MADFCAAVLAAGLEAAAAASFFFAAGVSAVIAGAVASGVERIVAVGDSSTVAEAFSSLDGDGDSSCAIANGATQSAMINGITGLIFMVISKVELIADLRPFPPPGCGAYAPRLASQAERRGDRLVWSRD